MPLSPFAILDFPELFGERRSVLFAAPSATIVAGRLDEVVPALAAAERAAAAGRFVVGYVGYEAAPAFDPALIVRPGARLPLLWFGVFDAPRELRGAADEGAGGASHAGLSAWEAGVGRGAYAAAIGEIRDAIAAGETYQVNFTLRLRSRLEGDDRALYRRMRAAQGGGYGAYLHLGRHRILSASPELFFRRRGDEIITRPMKGTARRGRWAEEDDAAAAALAASEKDRAENLMIADLLRNDLGRIARFGTVRVPRLFEVERYPTLFQMTSTVAATLAPGTTLADLFAALFPCGSVTGAPKVAAMRRIARHEDSTREVYCGAIGVIEPGGDCLFNVAIRTAWHDAETGVVEYGAGGGVTWDSTAEGEYEEALAKAELLVRDWPRFELLETLRLEDGRYPRLQRHLARLEASARYFGFAASPPAVAAALREHAVRHPASTRRVRVLVSAAGGVRVESEPLLRGPAGDAPVALAGGPVSRRDPFLFHKTTRRAALDAHRAARPELFDVLLCNEEGELTEFTRGNLVAELEGERWTPDRESGLLAGTFRAELLERGEVRERVLRAADLARATGLWLVNSVREWVPVRLVE